MLEPLFRCNLACAAAARSTIPTPFFQTDPEDALTRRECGAPVIVMAGGEPLLHETCQIVEGVIARKKFQIVCTNALLLERRSINTPSYFTWSIHLDGDQEMHDKSVCEPGVTPRGCSSRRPRRKAPRHNQLHLLQ